MNTVKTNDGSLTLKSEKFNECYHSSEGALKETLYKHVFPAFEVVKNENIKILDICFGLGYNTFASIIYGKYKKIEIYSPEFDEELIKSLKNFKYPNEFEKISHIINKVSKNFCYEDSKIKIEIYRGDAREYIKTFDDNFFDIVYQDAFSPKVNKELWTIEYFKEIKRIMKNSAVLTTYSVATPVRCALYTLGFNLYTHTSDDIRKGTIATFLHLNNFDIVDMKEKLKRVKCYYLED